MPPCEVRRFYDVICHGHCPHYKEDWDKNKLYMNCTDGLSYHCGKDNTTGEYVEACAESVRCERGKEPRIAFPEGHVKTAIVVCRYCNMDNFYNPYELKLSSTFYRCPKEKTRCDRTSEQIDCNYDRGVEKYFSNYKCRCDVRKGFIPELAVCPTESACQEASSLKCVQHKCNATSDGITQELLKDYCCAPVCGEDHQRNETSDLCVPISRSTLSTATTRSYIRTTATQSKKETNATKTDIETTVTFKIETSSLPNDNTPSTTPHTDTNGSQFPLVIILGVAVVALLILILIYCICRIRHRKGQDGQRDDDLEHEPLRDINRNGGDNPKETTGVRMADDSANKNDDPHHNLTVNTVDRKGEKEWIGQLPENIKKKELNGKLVADIASYIGENWIEVAYKMGLKKANIEQLTKNKTIYEGIIEVIHKWIEVSGTCTIEELLSILKECPITTIGWKDIKSVIEKA